MKSALKSEQKTAPHMSNWQIQWSECMFYSIKTNKNRKGWSIEHKPEFQSHNNSWFHKCFQEVFIFRHHYDST